MTVAVDEAACKELAQRIIRQIGAVNGLEGLGLAVAALNSAFAYVLAKTSGNDKQAVRFLQDNQATLIDLYFAYRNSAPSREAH